MHCIPSRYEVRLWLKSMLLPSGIFEPVLIKMDWYLKLGIPWLPYPWYEKSFRVCLRCQASANFLGCADYNLLQINISGWVHRASRCYRRSLPRSSSWRCWGGSSGLLFHDNRKWWAAAVFCWQGWISVRVSNQNAWRTTLRRESGHWVFWHVHHMTWPWGLSQPMTQES